MLGPVDGVGAMTAVDALDERCIVVTGFALVVEHHLHACPIEGHGIKAGHDTHVLEFRLIGRAIAVAIDRHVVHHVDVDDTTAHVVVYSLGSGSHRLEESVHRLRRFSRRHRSRP